MLSRCPPKKRGQNKQTNKQQQQTTTSLCALLCCYWERIPFFRFLYFTFVFVSFSFCFRLRLGFRLSKFLVYPTKSIQIFPFPFPPIINRTHAPPRGKKEERKGRERGMISFFQKRGNIYIYVYVRTHTESMYACVCVCVFVVCFFICLSFPTHTNTHYYTILRIKNDGKKGRGN